MEKTLNKVELYSFKPKKTINTDLFPDGETMDSSARLWLMQIADDFLEENGIIDSDAIVDYLVVGSLCNYNWSEFSDIDLHILVDFSEISDDTDFLKKNFDNMKNLWNNSHKDLSIFGYSVELYVQDVNESNESKGVYSLFKNKWIKRSHISEGDNIELNKFAIKCKAKEIISIVDGMEQVANETNDEFKTKKLYKDINRLKKRLSKMRKDGLSENGEYSNGNIVYKVLRRMGYLDKIQELKTKVYDKIFSMGFADI